MAEWVRVQVDQSRYPESLNPTDTVSKIGQVRLPHSRDASSTVYPKRMVVGVQPKEAFLLHWRK